MREYKLNYIQITKENVDKERKVDLDGDMQMILSQIPLVITCPDFGKDGRFPENTRALGRTVLLLVSSA